MNEYETVLLRRFASKGDAEAFAEITRLYAGMVHGSCLRVTCDPARAADAVQETFFHLAKNARQVGGSLAGWLHRVAVGKSVDMVRSDAARRRREQEYVAQPRETDRWADISPLVDEVLLEMDTPARELLLRHFFQGETITAIAAETGVSQPTASRRMEAAVEQLRARLRTRGVMVSAAVLGTLMAGAACSAPAAVLAELAKMAMVSPGTAAGATTTLAVMKTAAVVVAVAGLAGWMFYQSNRPMKSGTRSVETMRAAQPAEAPASMPAEAPMTVAPLPELVASSPDAPAAEPAIEGVASGAMAGASGGFTEQPPAPGLRFGGVMVVDSNPATPTGALNRFALALSTAAVWPERLRDCFETGSREFKGFERIIQAPQTGEERALQQCFLSLSAPVEVIETRPADDGMRVKWRARVRKEFSLVKDGVEKQWQHGDYFELEIRLKQVGSEWKIAGF